MKLIYISGIDGCGKTTQAELLASWLQSNGYSAEYQWLRWEPSIVPLIKSVKKRLGNGPRKNTERPVEIRSADEDKTHMMWGNIKSGLFSSKLFQKLWLWYATKDYYRAYRKACRQWSADYIIMDRYILDFAIDQSLNYCVDTNCFLETLESTSVSLMKKPDLSILIDIPAEVGYQRKLDGTALGYLKTRRDCYSQVADSENTIHIDGTDSVDNIHKQIRSWVSNHQ